MTTINSTPTAPPPVVVAKPSNANAEVAKKAEAAQAAASYQRQNLQPKKEAPDAEKAREAFIQKASENYRSAFFYPISDVKFTIYKDSTGQYVTRFTNLIDGKVTHVPEPEVISRYREPNPIFSDQV